MTQYLNLGPNKNYKTQVIIDRWEAERAKWLTPKQSSKDPKNGIPSESLPIDHT